MKPVPPPRLARTVLASLSVATACVASAQQRNVFEPGEWNGSIETGYEMERLSNHAAPGEDTHSSYQRTREIMTVRNSSFSLVDESLVSGNALLSFGQFQDSSKSDGQHDSGHGSLTGYGFDTTVLGGTPYPTYLHATRTQSFQAQSFGRTSTQLEDQGAEFRVTENSLLADRGLPFFSSDLRLERQHLHQDTDNVLGSHFAVDDTLKRILYEGHKGFETSDLNWNYSLDDVSDSLHAIDASRTTRAQLSYSLDFGSRLNWRLDSSANLNRLEARNNFQTESVQEHLHIDHRADLTSDCVYMGIRTEAPFGVTTSQSGNASVSYIYRNLTSTGQLNASHLTLPQGTIDVDGGRVQLAYLHSLPEGGALSAQLGAGQQLNNNRLTASSIHVVDEGHQAPAQLGAGNGFVLSQPFATLTSIVVIDGRGGARLPTVAGVDYDVVVEGNIARIVPRLTSAVIQPGDPLLVSYTYQVNPSIEYRTGSASGNVGVNYGWIYAMASHDEVSETLLSGQNRGFINEYHSNALTVDLRGSWRSVQLQGGAGYLRYISTLAAYSQWRAHQFALYRPASNVSIGLSGDWTVTDFMLPSRRSESTSVSLTFNRYSASGWSTNALLAHRIFSETQLPTEIVDEANVDERFQYGKFSLVAAAAVSRQERGAFNTFGWRTEVTLLRNF